MENTTLPTIKNWLGKKATYRTVLDLFTFYGLEHTVEEISK